MSLRGFCGGACRPHPPLCMAGCPPASVRSLRSLRRARPPSLRWLTPFPTVEGRVFLGAPLSRGYSSHALLPPCPRRRAWRAPCPAPFGRGLSCATRGYPPRRSVAAPRPTPPFPLLPAVAGDPSAAPRPVLGAPSGARFSARLLAAPALVAGVAGAGGFAPPFPLPQGLPLPPALLRVHAH